MLFTNQNSVSNVEAAVGKAVVAALCDWYGAAGPDLKARFDEMEDDEAAICIFVVDNWVSLGESVSSAFLSGSPFVPPHASRLTFRWDDECGSAVET